MTSEDIGWAQALYRGAIDKELQFKINCELFNVSKEKMLDVLKIEKPKVIEKKKIKREFKKVPIETKQKAIERYFVLKNYSKVASEFGLNHTTIRKWINELEKKK